MRKVAEVNKREKAGGICRSVGTRRDDAGGGFSGVKVRVGVFEPEEHKWHDERACDGDAKSDRILNGVRQDGYGEEVVKQEAYGEERQVYERWDGNNVRRVLRALSHSSASFTS